ncbi:Uncharacterised protein [Streptococcus pneumoniae]|nr:hypothetical protein [Streptococcus pneumoniae]CIP49593.1 Uncharacterised protein [Streptococcus pneumoniae]
MKNDVLILGARPYDFTDCSINAQEILLIKSTRKGAFFDKEQNEKNY